MKSRPEPFCQSVDGIFIRGRLEIEGLVLFLYVSRILKVPRFQTFSFSSSRTSVEQT